MLYVPGALRPPTLLLQWLFGWRRLSEDRSLPPSEKKNKKKKQGPVLQIWTGGAPWIRKVSSLWNWGDPGLSREPEPWMVPVLSVWLMCLFEPAGVFETGLKSQVVAPLSSPKGWQQSCDVFLNACMHERSFSFSYLRGAAASLGLVIRLWWWNMTNLRPLGWDKHGGAGSQGDWVLATS